MQYNGKRGDTMKLYTLQEVAEMLGVTYMTVWNLAKAGKIQTVNVGRLLRITQDEIDRLMKEGA